LIGKTVSHYRIVDKIGQGGMGVVYKAEDTKLQRTVALKFLPSDLIGAPEETARFMHEARAAAALSHPNICTIYEIDENAEQPFISMAYVEGKNLDEVMAGRPLKLGDAVRYASQIARGLEEAHTKGVIHRDIKSANVVVSDKGHAIVMDFGLAKLQGQTKLTRTGTTVGTVSYMSPEQARGGEADRRSDIWSLGVVLYHMVTGRLPFEGKHPSAVLYSILNEPHEPLTALRTGVPLELERIVDKALAKDPAARYQTVSDLIVDLKAVRDQLGRRSVRSETTGAPRPRQARRGWVFAGAALVIAVVGILGWWHFAGDRGASAPERIVPGNERVSIAVLPLANLSPDADQEYVADGMTEALIAELARIRALRVISRTSVMRFKGTTQSIPEVAATLGVNTIIEGSVLQAGDRVRVTAQLIDAETDEHLWAESYERDMSDVLALQSEVARAIASEVEVELTPSEKEHLASSGSLDPKAYDLYLRGRYYWNRRTQPDLGRARDLFLRVIDLEPDWGRGYAALAQALLVMGSWSTLPPGEAYPRGRDLAEKALDLEPDLGIAWACLAGVESEWNWDWDKAEEYFRKAIELEPNNASSHQWYAEFLSYQGRFDESLEQVALAQEIDPLSMIIRVVKAWIYTVMGEFDPAIAECERVIDLDPSFTGVYFYLGLAYRYDGQFDRAADAIARFYDSVHSGAKETIQDAYERGGIEAVVRAVIVGSRQKDRTEYVSPANVGFLFASIGEADSAMTWFERAYEQHAHPLEVAAVHPYCGPILDDPRFVDLLERMKLENVKRTRVRD
jgi:TolB-like protein/predicted Ser/Thr protein kinase